MTYYMNTVEIVGVNFFRRRSDDNFSIAHHPAEAYPYVERVNQLPTNYNLSFELTGSTRYDMATSIKAGVRPGCAIYVKSTDTYLYGTDQELWLSPVQISVKEAAGEVLNCELRGRINPAIIHTCDFVGDWYNSSGFSTVTADTTIKAAGKGSIRGYRANPPVGTFVIRHDWTPTKDLSDSSRLTVWHRSNSDDIDYTSGYMGLRVVSSGPKYSIWHLTTIVADTWYLEDIDLSAPDVVTGGGADLSAINEISIVVGTTTATANPFMLYIDDINVY